MKCQECDNNVRRLYDDPRTPPLDTEACLCRDCLQTAAEECIEECEEAIAELKRSLR